MNKDITSAQLAELSTLRRHSEQLKAESKRLEAEISRYEKTEQEEAESFKELQQRANDLAVEIMEQSEHYTTEALEQYQERIDRSAPDQDDDEALLLLAKLEELEGELQELQETNAGDTQTPQPTPPPPITEKSQPAPSIIMPESDELAEFAELDEMSIEEIDQKLQEYSDEPVTPSNIDDLLTLEKDNIAYLEENILVAKEMISDYQTTSEHNKISSISLQNTLNEITATDNPSSEYTSTAQFLLSANPAQIIDRILALQDEATELDDTFKQQQEQFRGYITRAEDITNTHKDLINNMLENIYQSVDDALDALTIGDIPIDNEDNSPDLDELDVPSDDELELSQDGKKVNNYSKVDLKNLNVPSLHILLKSMDKQVSSLKRSIQSYTKATKPIEGLLGMMDTNNDQELNRKYNDMTDSQLRNAIDNLHQQCKNNSEKIEKFISTHSLNEDNNQAVHKTDYNDFDLKTMDKPAMVNYAVLLEKAAKALDNATNQLIGKPNIFVKLLSYLAKTARTIVGFIMKLIGRQPKEDKPPLLTNDTEGIPLKSASLNNSPHVITKPRKPLKSASNAPRPPSSSP